MFLCLAIFQKHIGNEKSAHITLGKAEKLQRAILKNEEEQAAAAATAAANVTITSPAGEDKREEEERDRHSGEEKGSIFQKRFLNCIIINQLNLFFRRNNKNFRFSIKCCIKKSS